MKLPSYSFKRVMQYEVCYACTFSMRKGPLQTKLESNHIFRCCSFSVCVSEAILLLDLWISFVFLLDSQLWFPSCIVYTISEIQM